MSAAATDPTERPAARLHPDGRPVVLAVTVLVAVLACVSFALGVPGLLTVGSWAELPAPLAWGVPVMLDGGLVVFSAVATVRRARHESGIFAWTALVLLTLASMAAQVAHVYGTSHNPRWQVVAGAVLAAAFPAVVFASTHSLLDLAVAPPQTKARRAATARPARSTAPAPVLPATTTLATPASVLSAVSGSSQAATVRPAPAPRTTGRDGLTREQIAELAGPLREQGLSYQAIGDRLGLSKTRVMRALTSDNAGEAVEVAA